MKRFTCACLVAGLMAFGLTGCGNRPDKGTNGKTGVGVVDVAKLASELSWDMAVKNQGDADLAFAKSQITEFTTTLDNVINNKKKEIGEKVGKVEEVMNAKDPAELSKLGVTKDQLDQLISLYAQRNQLLQGAERQYQQILQQRQMDLNRQYRQILQPYARQIAEDRGLAEVVMVPSEGVLFTDPSVDITLAVCDRVRKERPTPPALQPMPGLKINGPAPTSQPAP